MYNVKTAILAIAWFLTCMGVVHANDAPLTNGWSLEPQGATLNFVSVKKGNVIELSRFATVSGAINEDGTVQLEIPLDSVDTSIDLRNVRMRFLFFKSFEFPVATVTSRITQDMLAGLEQAGTKNITLPFTLNLHGNQVTRNAEVLVSLIGPDRISVSSAAPILLKVEEFGLLEGLAALEDAAKVTIAPVTSVTFNFSFTRNGKTGNQSFASLANGNTALEPVGEFSNNACTGRFEILSRSRSIQFQQNSANLRSESTPFLKAIAEIVDRCPDMIIQVAGHTDSIGDPDYNLGLSIQRAEAVVNYLVAQGVTQNRFSSTGFGESRPIADNDTSGGRQKNRRIEFSIWDASN